MKSKIKRVPKPRKRAKWPTLKPRNKAERIDRMFNKLDQIKAWNYYSSQES